MNDRAKYKGRMAIYAMAGVYLLAQAYYMYKDIPTSSGTDKILMSIFMVVFAVIGAGMVIMGVTKSYKAIKEDYNAVPEEEKKMQRLLKVKKLLWKQKKQQSWKIKQKKKRKMHQRTINRNVCKCANERIPRRHALATSHWQRYVSDQSTVAKYRPCSSTFLGIVHFAHYQSS